MEIRFKRFLSLALALLMVLSNVPVQAFATDSDPACVHESAVTVITEATCMAAGSKAEICSACGTTITEEELPVVDHVFVDGVCKFDGCGEVDPNYVPPHECVFVDGKCECGNTDPNYVPPHECVYVDGKCECGNTDPNYVPPHECVFVDGKCECGNTDPAYVAPVNEEELQAPEVVTYTVYFDNSTTGWEKVYAGYGDSELTNPAYQEMTAGENNIWSVEIPEGNTQVVFADAASLTAAYYGPYKIEDGKKYAPPVSTTVVAKIGDTEYTSLAAAVNKAKANDTITVVADSTETNLITITNDLTIDLGGKTLNVVGLFITSGTVNISNGTLIGTTGGYSTVQTFIAGNVVLTDVDVTGLRHAVRVQGGSAEINGGTITAAGTGTTHAVDVGEKFPSSAIINGGTFVGPAGTSADSGAALMVQDKATVTVNGGDFSGGKGYATVEKIGTSTLTINAGTFDQDPSAYLEKGYEATEKNGTWTVRSDGKLYVSNSYNTETPGYGTICFSNYAAAYAYAVANNTKATIVIEKTNTLSGNTFDNNHKNYSRIGVVVEAGAAMGNALSKWDMTYPVTVKAGGKLDMARPANASISYMHIKNALVIGETDGEKAYANFLSDTYQDGDMSIRYNGSVTLNNAAMTVQDLDAQGKLTATDSTIEVDGAFATATFYATTLTNSTVTVGGKQISGGLSDFAEKTYDNRLGNVTMTDSHITFESGSVNVGSTVTLNGTSSITADEIFVTSKLVVNDSSTVNGKIVLAKKSATVVAAEGLNVITNQEGYNVVYEGGTYKLVEKTYAAQIGDVKYETLQAAIDAAAKTGDTIKLLADINIADVEIQTLGGKYNTLFHVAGKTVTVDLAGKIISGAYAGDSMLVGVFSTENDGHLTLTGNGIIDVTATGTVYSLLVSYDETASLTVENGTYKLDKASDSLIYTGGDENVTIKDGAFTLGNVGSGSNGSPWIFNAKGQNTANIIVKGGTFNADIIHQFYPFEVMVSKELALKQGTDGIWSFADAVAYVNEQEWSSAWYTNEVGYATLEEALNAAEPVKTKNGKTSAEEVVTLLKNAEVTGTAVVKEGTTLNCNSFSVVLANENATLTAAEGLNVVTSVENHEVVYEGGTYKLVEKTYAAQIGDVKYETLQAAIDGAAKTGDTIELLADIELEKTELQVLDGYDTYFLVEDKSVTIDLNEKTISGAYTGSMLVGVFSTDKNGHLTLTGNGTIDVTATNKVYALIVSYNDGSTITIENGTYKLDAASDSLVFYGGYTDAAVTVKGGTFTLGNVGAGENGKPWIFNVLGAGDHHVYITGGTFNADINRQHWSNEAVVAKECYVVENNGTWTVEDGAVAYVHTGMTTGPYYAPKDIGYATLVEAVAKAEALNDNPVTLLADNAEDVAISKAITLEVNGKSYTGTITLAAADATLTAPAGLKVVTNVVGSVVSYADGVYSVSEWDGKIWNKADLLMFQQMANDGNTSFSGKTIKLMADVDLGGMTWTPIKNFLGTFDGVNHTISNFHLDATKGHAGFFYKIDFGNGTTLKDLTLSDITATVGNYYVGALAYFSFAVQDNITIRNFTVTTTSSEANVGGYAGWVEWGHIRNCTIENMTVNAEKGAGLIGGLAAVLKADNWLQYNYIDVKGFTVNINDTDGKYAEVGGLVGQTQTGHDAPVFTNCDITGIDVKASGLVTVGGLVARPGAHTTATNCTTEGKIDVTGVTSANESAGGFFGNLGWNNNESSRGGHKLTNCSADVDIVTKIAPAGGFVGAATNEQNRNMAAAFTNCSATGTITVAEGGTANIGGFAGEADRGTYNNCTAAREPFIGYVRENAKLVNVNSYVAQVGQAYYATFDAALAAAKASEAKTMTLLVDVEFNEDTTIDLEGVTINGMLVNKANMTVKATNGGKIDGGDLVAIDNYGTLTIEGGTFTGAQAAIYNNELESGEATVTINGGEFIAPGDYCATIENRYGILTVNGGKITATNSAGYAIVDTCGVTTITNGEIVSAQGTAVETYQGEITIDGGDFTGKVIVENQAGKVEVKGGKLISNTPEYYYGLTIADGGTTTLYGGTFERDYDTAEGTSVKIADGYESVANDDGTYTVKKEWNLEIHNVEDMLYFANEVNAGNTFAGKTIKLMADLDLAGIEWSPIGGDSVHFAGEFAGNEHTISNLTQTQGARMGLFGLVEKAYIHDFTLKNVNFTVNENNARVGAVAGNLQYWNVLENITIDGINVTANGNDGLIGSVTGYVWKSQLGNVDVKNATYTVNGTGNVIGGHTAYGRAHVWDSNVTGNNEHWLDGTVQTIDGVEYVLQNYFVDCDVDGITMTLNGTGTEAGGFIGSDTYNSHSNYFVDSHVTDLNVTAAAGTSQTVGGFMAWNNGTTSAGTVKGFDGCSVSGTITGADGIYGGFVGQVGGRACEYNNATANVNITSTGIAGGFVGATQAYSTHKYTFNNCTATGNVSGSVAGAFTGKNGMSGDGKSVFVEYNNNEATGTVTATSISGGFIGEVNTELPATNWNIVDSTGSLVLNNNTASAKANVTGNATVGYLIGYLDGVANGDAKEGNTVKLTLEGNTPDGSDIGTGTGHHINVSEDTILDDIDVVKYVAKIGETQYKTLAKAIEEAQPNDTIILLDNITEDVTVNESITIDGAQYEYTGSITAKGNANSTAVIIKNVNFVGGTTYAVTTDNIKSITIENCTVTNQSLLYAKRSTPNVVVKNVNISGGNYVAHLVYGNTAYFEDVTATAMTGYGIYTQNYGAKTITLKNCNFDTPNHYALTVKDDRSTNADTFIFEGTNSMSSLYKSEYAKYELVKDATLTAPEGANVTTNVEGHGVIYKNGTYMVAPFIAQVDETKYASLTAALNACTNGETVKLIADVVYGADDVVNAIGGATGFGDYPNPSIVYIGGTRGATDAENQPSNVNAVLDLNGYSITNNAEAYLFLIMDNAKLTIKDSGNGDGIIGNTEAPVLWVTGTETVVTIESGKYTVGDYGSLMWATHSGDLVITGGEFSTSADDASSLIMRNEHDRQNSQYFISGKSTVTVTGGTFHGFNPELMLDDSKTPAYQFNAVAEGFAAVENNGVYTVDVKTNVTIGSVEELIAFGNAVTGNTKYQGVKVAANPEITVTLTADLDLTGSAFAPIGNGSGNAFAGTFDGGKHTISNMTLSCDYYRGVGFFRSLGKGAVVKDLTFENANINNGAASGSNHFYGVVAGFSNNLTLDNVDVKNSSVTCKYSGAAMVGCLEGATVIKNCDIENVALKTTNLRGAVFGILGNSATGHTAVLENNTVNNVNFIVDDEYKNVKETLKYDEWKAGTEYTESNYVAQIGDTKYVTLYDAVAAAKNGDTITLIGHVKRAASLIVDKDVTIDLNGKIVSVDKNVVNAPVMRILADVTVKNGTVDGTNGNGSYAFIVGNNDTAGTLTITDGTYKGRVSAVSITKGTANISGGYFEATEYNGAHEFTLNCIDSAYKDGIAVYNITGGKFYKFNPENNAAEGAGTNFLSASYVAVYNGNNVYEVVDYIKWIKAELLAGRDVKLEKDIVVDGSMIESIPAPTNGNGRYPNYAIFTVIGDEVTFDLNGHSITYNGHKDFQWNGKTYNSCTVAHGLFYANAGADLTVEDSVGTGTVTVYGLASGAYVASNDTTFTITGGTWKNEGCAECGGTNIFLYPLQGGELYITGGYFEQALDSAGESYLLVEHGGEYKNSVIDYAKTKIEISGGTFVGMNPEQAKYFYQTADNKLDMNQGPKNVCAEGFASVDNGDGSYTVKPVITVKFDNVTMVYGNALPKFTHTTNFTEIADDGLMLVVGEPEVTVNGVGEYEITAEASIFMNNDYVVKVIPGKLTVVEAVASIGTTMYGTLQAAIDGAAKTGDTIKLLTDINLEKTELQVLDGYDTYFLVEDKNVTIDLNEKTISGAYNGSMLVGVFSTDKNGHLTLTGNGTVDVTATTKVYSLIVCYNDGSTITIENGTYKLDKASDNLIFYGGYTDAEVTVKGGTFTLGNVGTGENGKPWIFNVLGAGDHHVYITGGTFNADINRQHWSNEAVVAKECYVVNDGTWTVKDGAVAYVHTGMTTGPYYAPKDIGYATLVEAVAKAEALNDNPVTLLADNEEDVAISKAITLEVNDKSYTGTVTLTVADATLTAAEGLNVVTTVENAKVVYEDGVYKVATAVAMNVQQNNYYFDVQVALNEAKPGETVMMLKDVKTTVVNVFTGVTLDLNGMTLETMFLAAFNTTDVVDNSTDKTAKLVVAKDNIVLASDNSQMPVWNEDHYAFATMKVNTDSTGTTDDVLKILFKHTFGKKKFSSLFADGMDDNGLKVVVELTWTTEDGKVGTQSFVYTEALEMDVYGNNKAFSFGAAGLSKYEGMTAYCKVVSDLGVEFSSAAITLVQ